MRPPENASDEDLMVRYGRGDTEAFDVLFRRHRGGVYNFIARFLGDPSRAEEVFQDVFEKVIRAAGSYEPRAKLTTWLYRIVRNGCIDAERRQRYRRTVSLSDPVDPSEVDPPTLGERIAGDAPGPERDAGAGETRRILARAIEGLPPEQREVLILREKMDLPFDEIAEVVGCPVNTAKSRMRYALEGMRRALAGSGLGPTSDEGEPGRGSGEASGKGQGGGNPDELRESG